MAVLAATMGTRYIQFLRTDDPYLPQLVFKEAT